MTAMTAYAAARLPVRGENTKNCLPPTGRYRWAADGWRVSADGAAADHYVAVVQYNGLTGGDGALRFVKG